MIRSGNKNIVGYYSTEPLVSQGKYFSRGGPFVWDIVETGVTVCRK